MRRTWGVLHVMHERSSGRASRLLRPVLLAGAATAMWLTLSATAASAETGTDVAPRPGPDTARLALTTQPDFPRHSVPPDSGGDSSGLLSPVLGAVTGVADDLASSIPAVPAVVPAGTVSELTSPAVQTADKAAVEVVGTAIRVVPELLVAAAPVIDPLGEVVTGSTPIPLPPVVSTPHAPGGPAAVQLTASPAGVRGAPATHHDSAPVAVAAVSTPVSDPQSMASQLLDFRAPPAAGGASAPVLPGGEAGGDELPATLPGVPGSGAGTSQSPPGPSTATETGPFRLRPPSGVGEADRPLLQLSNPVSFDPGSSPD